jgi:hypothetical protein
MSNKYVQADAHSMAGNHFSASSAPKGADTFTTGAKKTLPNHNPKQPWLGLDTAGAHTHAGAARAANAVNDKMAAPARKPGTQATLETPAATGTQKSMSQGRVMKTFVKPDDVNADASGFPKGNSNGG